MRPIKVIVVVKDSRFSLYIDKQDEVLRNKSSHGYISLFSADWAYIVSSIHPSIFGREINVRGCATDYDDEMLAKLALPQENDSGSFMRATIRRIKHFRRYIGVFVLMNSYAMYPSFCCGIRDFRSRWFAG